jgi:hypothetical protein
VSRSYRKPYTAVTGTKSAHNDKKMAARGLRRRQNQWLHTLEDVDGALIPHRLECAYNNTYNWGRDGRQHLVFPDCRRTNLFEFMYRHWLKLHRK